MIFSIVINVIVINVPIVSLAHKINLQSFRRHKSCTFGKNTLWINTFWKNALLKNFRFVNFFGDFWKFLRFLENFGF